MSSLLSIVMFNCDVQNIRCQKWTKRCPKKNVPKSYKRKDFPFNAISQTEFDEEIARIAEDAEMHKLISKMTRRGKIKMKMRDDHPDADL